MISPPVTVVGVGAATWDDFWLVEEFSDRETVVQALNHFSMGGGPVATALCVLSRLGHRCALIDAQGNDHTGTAIIRDLEAAEVDTSHLQVLPEACSARATILVRRRDGARQIVYSPATAGEPVWNSNATRLLSGARLLHLNGRHETAARAAVHAALNCGVTISFDGGAGRYRKSIEDLVWASHLRIVARDFGRQLTGQDGVAPMLQALLRPPAQLAVVTDGLNGSWVAIPGAEPHHEPARRATPLVDSTGCGDVYHGAFLHGWLNGWEMQRCAAHASTLAARNAEGLGGRYLLTQPDSAQTVLKHATFSPTPESVL